MHTVKIVSRSDLVNELRALRASSSLRAKLGAVTVRDVRNWEDDVAVPPRDVREAVARVLGVPLDLLDPDSGTAISGDFLQLVSRFGLRQKQIAQLWKVYKGDLAFRGTPGIRDLERLVRSDPSLVFDAVQNDLFIDEFRCKSCGHWEGSSQNKCPNCHEEN